MDFAVPDWSESSGLSDGSESINFVNSFLSVRAVPDTWSTWNAPPAVEISDPKVGATEGSSSLLIALQNPAYTFGFELEPDALQTEEVAAYYFSGNTPVGILDLFPSGQDGAQLFAAATSNTPFSYVYIMDFSDDDFAIGRIRYSLDAEEIAPEPGTRVCLLVLLAAVVLGKFVHRWRSHKSVPSAR